MQSEQLRQRRRERKRLERERNKKASRKAQMCAGDELDFLVPRRVAALFGRALRVAREEAGRPISPGEGLVRMARHFVDTWGLEDVAAFAPRSSPLSGPPSCKGQGAEGKSPGYHQR